MSELDVPAVGGPAGRASPDLRRASRPHRLVRAPADAELLCAHASADDGRDAWDRLRPVASMLVSSALLHRPGIHELLITLFVLITSPVSAMTLMRAAVFALECMPISGRIELTAQSLARTRTNIRTRAAVGAGAHARRAHRRGAITRCS